MSDTYLYVRNVKTFQEAKKMKVIKENGRKALVYHEMTRNFEIWQWSEADNTYASFGCGEASLEEIKKFCDNIKKMDENENE